MPVTETPVVTPGEKLMLQRYQGRLAERLLQATSLAQNRNLLRRGARKMQDGTLGTASDGAEEEPVNIHIGDMTVTQSATPLSQAEPTTPASKKDIGSLLKTLLISAALAAGPGIGVAIPWALGAFDRPAAAAVVDTDTDTRYKLQISGSD